MNQRKNFAQELSLWTQAAKNIGVDFSNLENIESKTISSSEGLMFSFVYSPKRTERPDQTKVQESMGSCNMCNEIERYQSSKDNALDDRAYNGHLIFPNLYPILPGHVVLIQPDHNKRIVTKDDLESMVGLSKERDYHIWHNMIGAGSTMPHDHFQGVPYKMPLEDLEIVSRNGNLTVKGYPGKNRAFIGDNKTSEAISYIERLNENSVPYTINITDNIFVFPIRYPQTKGGIGGFETALGSVSRDMDEYNKLTADMLSEKLKRVLC